MSARGGAAALALVLAAALAAALAAGAAEAGAAPAQTPIDLRVMTWNIAAGHGNLTQIADVIGHAAPDIVALQEVDVHWSTRSGFEDQAARLGALTGLAARFGRIYHLEGAPGAPAREFGLAVLSRLPIAGFTSHVIPRLSTQSAATTPEPLPGFLEVVLEAGGRPVHVFNTHLDYRPDPSVRSAQVAAMLERLPAVSAPVVLMGDLNAPPAAPEIAPLFRRLTDAWAASSGSDQAGTGAGHTYPADAPVRRIDYILTSGPLAVRDIRVVSTDASDHRPVVADLILR